MYENVVKSPLAKVQKKICITVFDELLDMLDCEQVEVLLKYEEEKEEYYRVIKDGIVKKIAVI